MVRVIALLTVLAAACSQEPAVLRPNNATHFRIDFTIVPLESRARECRTEPTPKSRPCRVRFSMTVENTGDQTADAICLLSIEDPTGHPLWGQDVILGTMEPGQSTTRTGNIGFRGQLGEIRTSRCSSYEVGSTANHG
jgi:hypothetical protein